MKRRDALKVLGSSAALVTVLPVLASGKKLALRLDKAEKLREVGGSVLLKIKDKDVLFIRTGEEVIRALDPLCPHKQCTVKYDPGQDLIICPCHGSTYTTAGKLLKGPATKSLTAFEATLSGDRIIFSMD